MPDSEFSVNLTADVSGLTEAMDTAKESVSGAAEEMASAGEEGGSGLSEGLEGAGEAMNEFRERADSMIESIGKMSEGWSGLLAVLGGGAISEIMEHLAQTTIAVGDSMRQTGAAFGVGDSEARGINETFESLGVSSGAAATAVRRLALDVANGGKALSRLKDDAGGVETAHKSMLEVFEQATEKINNISDSGQKAQAAYTLFGRAGMQLLGVLPQLNSALEENIAEQQANAEVNKLAEQQTMLLHAAVTKMESAWNDGVIRVAPLVVSALRMVDSALIELEGYCHAASVAIENVFSLAGKFGSVMSNVGTTADAMFKAAGDESGNPASPDAVANAQASLNSLSNSVKAYGDTWSETGTKIQGILKESEQKSADMLDSALRRSTEAQEGLTGGLEAAIKSPPLSSGLSGDGSGQFAPKGGGGGGRGGGGGGADPMAGMDNALDRANEQMTKLNSEFDKLGSEAGMAAKEGGLSFDQLRDKALQDYQVMQQKYREFTSAVDSGSKQAAQAADQAWHLAAQNFQKDWDQARAKAEQDMKQIKSAADSMASEVSGILNSAISGKLNWAQEFDKILSQMADKLLKHLSEQIAMWIAHEAQVNATKQAGATAGLAIQKEANAAAGTSDAVTAAKGAYSSAAQIPYIGWIIAPIAAAAAFAGVEAFGSAEGGMDIPSGVAPMMQLHPREMVLPASLAENVRKMSAGGGGGGNTSVTQNINAIDSRSFLDIVDSNHQGIAQAVAKARRSGARFATG